MSCSNLSSKIMVESAVTARSVPSEDFGTSRPQTVSSALNYLNSSCLTLCFSGFNHRHILSVAAFHIFGLAKICRVQSTEGCHK
jgi:hypothetical protein